MVAASALVLCASCRTTDTEKKILSDLEALKTDVARVTARQDTLEREVMKQGGAEKPEVKEKPKAEARTAPEPERAGNIKVPNLKVVKMKDDAPPSKKARSVDVVSTPDRPFGDTGPEISEGAAANVLQHSELPGMPLRAESNADPNKVYARALQQFSEADCGNAVVTFEDFIRQNPGHPKAPQAVYYVGECYFNRGEFAIALSEFTRVAEQFRGAKQVPMALYKAGMCLKSLKDIRGARQTLQKVKEEFASEEAGLLAAKELERLK
jgi:tol-pal system protein YbgF